MAGGRGRIAKYKNSFTSINTTTMQYLGTYKITPNTKEIEVDCYGIVQPYERKTLEHPGCAAYNQIESVKHGDNEISDYLSDRDYEVLQLLVNNK
jgi:hypothetical protein